MHGAQPRARARCALGDWFGRQRKSEPTPPRTALKCWPRPPTRPCCRCCLALQCRCGAKAPAESFRSLESRPTSKRLCPDGFVLWRPREGAAVQSKPEPLRRPSARRPSGPWLRHGLRRERPKRAKEPRPRQKPSPQEQPKGACGRFHHERPDRCGAKAPKRTASRISRWPQKEPWAEEYLQIGKTPPFCPPGWTKGS